MFCEDAEENEWGACPPACLTVKTCLQDSRDDFKPAEKPANKRSAFRAPDSSKTLLFFALAEERHKGSWRYANAVQTAAKASPALAHNKYTNSKLLNFAVSPPTTNHSLPRIKVQGRECCLRQKL